MIDYETYARIRDCRDRQGLTITQIASTLGRFDLAYLDPPYNQHRYFTNYHIWETLVAWDAPEHYGVACKRVDARDQSTKSRFNERRAMATASSASRALCMRPSAFSEASSSAWTPSDTRLTPALR